MFKELPDFGRCLFKELPTSGSSLFTELPFLGSLLFKQLREGASGALSTPPWLRGAMLRPFLGPCGSRLERLKPFGML